MLWEWVMDRKFILLLCYMVFHINLCIQALCDTRYHCIKMHTENISVKFVIRSKSLQEMRKTVNILNFGLMHIRFGNIGTFRYGIRTMQHILE